MCSPACVPSLFVVGLLAFACARTPPRPADSARNGGAGAGTGGARGLGGSAAGDEDSNGVDADSLGQNLSARFPAAGGTGVCVDAQLRLTFSRPVTLGTAGTIRVYADADPTTPVDVIDMSATTSSITFAGRTLVVLRPVYIEGRTAVVYLEPHSLAADQTYHVNVDRRVFLDTSGASLGAIQGPGAWHFTTGAGVPANPAVIRVALDGSGDFCSVQGAVDVVPGAATGPVLIRLENGTYHEIVVVSAKHDLTIRGEDREQTVIAAQNNEHMNGGAHLRGMFSAEAVRDFTLENLTLRNTTPQDGGQAEALHVDGGARVAVRHVDLLSLQDTLLLDGTTYLYDCYVGGNVDYVWGKGSAYFEQCELKTVNRKGYQVQARNTSEYGYVFVNSKLTAAPGITGHYLGRVDVDRFPRSNVAYLDCRMGPHVVPEGWMLTGGTDTSKLRFWEYRSTDLTGAPLDVSRRARFSRQLSAAEAAAVRDKATVLGGWAPAPG